MTKDEYERWWNSLPELDRKMIRQAWERHKAAEPKKCDCGAVLEGEWAGVHSPTCASGQDRPKDRPTDRIGVPYGVGPVTETTEAGPARWIKEVAELRAENERLREALRQIVEWEPATQELTLANEMADVAKRALG